ncbi:ubiquinol oxidase subunit II [Buchnera aphidicola (Thelaxes californica)]|uniref:Ubiquinol oxidase subunit 2 n=1 Tax=Buchnera aphidicola (Thelaxes californica) TaxID=1315998 RepID=A0A4D6YFK2_9GAMM|nr:ubiquinol oxidase subunit II [Buchnera aphidicola]QCI26883.1 ubiquinol oxidase subunit II [Buchnera aphidicola (Thelaxes californica)]
MQIYKNIKILFFFSFMFLFTGYRAVILNPSGEIGIKIKSLILISFFVMLIVVIPSIFLSIFFAIKYSSKNCNVKYSPHWSDSKKIETTVWLIPFLIIFFLGILSWKATHELDQRKLISSNVSPIVIDVISLDWRWLFIYEKEKIATINKIVIPVNTPIIFKITSNSVMNSFFIPSLGSQIYAMSGMESKLNLIANKVGIYQGISSNYSGSGFSDMKFSIIVTKNNNLFQDWVTVIKKFKRHLNTYQQFVKISCPNHSKKTIYFSCGNPQLFYFIINKVHHEKI